MAKRLYTLFTVERLPNGKKRYTQTDKPGFEKETAIRVYQGNLLSFFMGTSKIEYELRPVKKIPDMHFPENGGKHE